MNASPPVVIALVSGKGGVGKTMLSVAVARELSLSNRTLIVDLDFFNRGLTGLMSKGPTTCEIDKPDFLLEESAADSTKWRIIKVAKNLLHIEYPDLLPEEMQRFETLDVNVLKESLGRFIQEAAQACNCDCVVLDCHGGPDNSSFAACLFSDYTILVSEPDRITFYGTLNFLRQLKRIGGEQEVNLHLVFNKVVPAFSGLFLRSLYNRLIREHFSGRPLLGIFPLEVYLTKEFEKTPFLTAVYPGSLLAKKTRTLLYDLLARDHADKLPRVVRSLPGWMRAYTKLTLGKQLPIFNINVVMSTIVIVMVMFAFLYLSLRFFPSEREQIRSDAATIRVLQCVHHVSALNDKTDAIRQTIVANRIRGIAVLIEELRKLVYELPIPIQGMETFVACTNPNAYYASEVDDRRQALATRDPASVPSPLRDLYDESVLRLEKSDRLYLGLQTIADSVENSVGPLYVTGVGWLALVLLINWSTQLDRRFTYHCRARHRGSIWGPYLITILLWFFPLLVITWIAKTLGEISGFASALVVWLAWSGFIALVSVVISIVIGQAFRVYRDLRYEGHYVEDTLRLVFLGYVLFAPVILYFGPA